MEAMGRLAERLAIKNIVYKTLLTGDNKNTKTQFPNCHQRCAFLDYSRIGTGSNLFTSRISRRFEASLRLFLGSPPGGDRHVPA